MANTPKNDKSLAVAVETKSRLEKCWKTDINWELYPEIIHEVRYNYSTAVHNLV